MDIQRKKIITTPNSKYYEKKGLVFRIIIFTIWEFNFSPQYIYIFFPLQMEKGGWKEEEFHHFL